MGLFKSDEEKRAKARQELNLELAVRWPAGEPPYVDSLPLYEGPVQGLKTSLEAINYIAHVGVLPEDTYGIYLSHLFGAGVQGLTVVYRDRPEYAPRRELYWQDRAGPPEVGGGGYGADVLLDLGTASAAAEPKAGDEHDAPIGRRVDVFDFGPPLAGLIHARLESRQPCSPTPEAPSTEPVSEMNSCLWW